MSYLSGGGRFNTINGPLANPPGSSYQATFSGATGLEYLDMTKLAAIVPVPVSVKPMQPIPLTDRAVSLTAFDSHYTTPYVQNMTLAITRNVGRKLTLDSRYIGTMSRKLYDSVNLNSPNFLYNGLKEAFDSARFGGESALLDQMFKGINIAGTNLTGAQQLRAATASTLRNDLANGNYSSLATKLSILNYSKSGTTNAGLPDVPANTLGTVLRLNGFPENFIKTNPQFGTATLQTNMGNTNYHSLQAQGTLRPVAGVSFQASYTWSKLLGNAGGYTNPVDRKPDYGIQTGDRRHDFRTNGTFELPFGPGQMLARNTHGVVARIIEGWQMTWIVDLTSGAPTSITAQSMLYANGVPDVVGKFDPSIGKIDWKEGDGNGNYFAGAYKKVPDPQCAAIEASLRSACTLTAIADASGNIILQNPKPGTRGNLGQNVIEMPGTWSLDTSMGKSFKISESKKVGVRLDAANILNHPQPSNPDLNINSSVTFGNILTKTGTRTFQAQVRLEF
jgi:hypothetical protein